MAKGQQRGNREAKKPKKEKPNVAATAQASFGLIPLKSTGQRTIEAREIARRNATWLTCDQRETVRTPESKISSRRFIYRHDGEDVHEPAPDALAADGWIAEIR